MNSVKHFIKGKNDDLKLDIRNRQVIEEQSDFNEEG